MSQQFVLFLKREIILTEDSQAQELILKSECEQLTFKSVQPGINKAIKSLANGGATLDNLTDWVQNDTGLFPTFKLHRYLQKFTSMGWLCYSVVSKGRTIATALPISTNFNFPNLEVKDTSEYVLSRFAYIHCIDGQMVLESPLSQVKINLIDPCTTTIVSQLAKPCKCEQLTNLALIGSDILKQFVGLLLNTQMVSPVNEDGTIPEQANITLSQWEFHDLLFHSRSRSGRQANPCGGTYRFKDKISPLRAIKPRMSSNAIALYKPDLETLQIKDIPFSQVLENRKSIREYGGKSITAHQLGEFLFRSARVKQNFQSELGEFTSRPYPSGGALYELELYPVINNCQDIDSGLYYYQPQTHELCKLANRNDSTDTLLLDAARSMGQQNKPQVLIVIAARFQRLTWKYESIAYALLLKHVGALYQTMYLVATSMNLAPCGLGVGDSDLFAKAIGSNYYAETSVGEFVLGSRKSEFAINSIKNN